MFQARKHTVVLLSASILLGIGMLAVLATTLQTGAAAQTGPSDSSPSNREPAIR